MLAALLWACSAPPAAGPDRPTEPAADRGFVAPSIISMQRARRGARLVFLDESGDRRGDLTKIGSVPLRDNSPVWSPDGKWVVFASSRTRDDMLATSLWLIAPTVNTKPRRLTRGDHDDRDPVWLPDSSGLVFASNRGGDRFALWRLDLRPGPSGVPVPAGAPTRLIERPRHTFHPSISPDGDRIVYTEADLETGHSALWIWQPGQPPRQLTQGPADSTPAWSPDGKTIAFAAPAAHAAEAGPAPDLPDDIEGDDIKRDSDGAPDDSERDQLSAESDLDLYLIDADGSDRRQVIAEPLALQNHPVWSPDGRYLFCTSLFRSVATGKPILSSVTFIDLSERPPLLRALHDPLVVESRASPTFSRAPLDASRLHQNPAYREALNEAITQYLIQREQPR